MMRRIAYLLTTMVCAALSLAWFTPSQMPAGRPVYIAPSPTHTMPACETEDGAGMALCYWDAQGNGNGKGNSIISGDCAAEWIGGMAAQNECVMLYTMGQDAIDFVGECIEINNTISNSDRIKLGWSPYECFKSFN